jgi:hypothetical protein
MIIKKIKIDVEIREVESKNINFIIISIWLLKQSNIKNREKRSGPMTKPRIYKYLEVWRRRGKSLTKKYPGKKKKNNQDIL